MATKRDYYSFDTVKREKASAEPSEKLSDKKELHRLFDPHIKSFNAITDFDSYGGLIDHAIDDLPRVHAKDSKNNTIQGNFECFDIGKRDP
jgi:hypothetical protein